MFAFGLSFEVGLVTGYGQSDAVAGLEMELKPVREKVKAKATDINSLLFKIDRSFICPFLVSTFAPNLLIIQLFLTY